MDAQALLARILASRQPDDVFSRVNFRKEYLTYLKLLHPDVCHLPLANDAVARLNHYVELLEAALRLTDDAARAARLRQHLLITCLDQLPDGLLPCPMACSPAGMRAACKKSRPLNWRVCSKPSLPVAGLAAAAPARGWMCRLRVSQERHAELAEASRVPQ